MIYITGDTHGEFKHRFNNVLHTIPLTCDCIFINLD